MVPLNNVRPLYILSRVRTIVLIITSSDKVKILNPGNQLNNQIQNYCSEPRIVLNVTPHMCALGHNIIASMKIKLYFATFNMSHYICDIYNISLSDLKIFGLSVSLALYFSRSLSLSWQREKNCEREIGRHLENGYDQIQRNFKF